MAALSEKQQLMARLDQVKRQISMLEEVETRLFRMRSMAQRAIDHQLSKEEVSILNLAIQKLETEVILLRRKVTQLS